MPGPASTTTADAWRQHAASCDAGSPPAQLWQCLHNGLTLLEQHIAQAQTPSAKLLEALLRLVIEIMVPACARQREAMHMELATELSALEQRYRELDAATGDHDPGGLVRLHRLRARLWFLHLLALAMDGSAPQPYTDLITFLGDLRGHIAGNSPEASGALLDTLNGISLEVMADQGLHGAADALDLADSASAVGDGLDQREGNAEQQRLALDLLRCQQQMRRLHTLLLDALAPCTEDAGVAVRRARMRAHSALSALERAESALMTGTIALIDRLPEASAQDWLQRHSTVVADLAADTLSDIPDRNLNTQVTVLEQSYCLLRAFREGLLQSRRKALSPTWKQLHRLERQLRAEWVEAGISATMARRFGRRFERWLDLGVVTLVLAAVGILLVDLGGGLSPAALRNVILLDSAICAGLLGDFLLRLKLAPDRRDFFRRHWFTDLLPSIPFAGIGLWIFSVSDGTQSITALRALRVIAVALRKARPLIQIARVFLFGARGMDRLVRRYRHLLNWDILFFEPKPMKPAESLRLRGERLGHRIRARSRSLLGTLDGAQRSAAMRRNLKLARHIGQALARLDAPQRPQPTPTVARQIAVETVIDRLTHTDPYEIGELLGVDFGGRLKRLAWIAALPPLRWLPLFNDVLSARSQAESEIDFAQTLAHRLGARLQWLNDKVMFLSDLHGIITAPQFVDRIGNTLVQSMRRPRNRLLMLGAGFIVVTLLVEVLPFDWLEAASQWLRKTLGWPILILGLIAFAAVWFGNRLRRLARTNSDFYTRIAEAKSINLLGDVKRAHAADDQAVLARRVLRPEARIQGLKVNTSAAPAHNHHDVTAHFRQMVLAVLGEDRNGIAGSLAERVYLLYRDYLRGAHFDRSNTHSTDHLLGSPSLINLRNQVLHLDAAAQQQLEDLDLRRASGLAGPSLWLRFVTHAMTQRVGQLVEEYNRHAMPLDERAAASHDLAGGPGHASDEATELQRFEEWLATKTSDTPTLADGELAQAEPEFPLHYATGSFNALDFLSNDPARDSAIEARFGTAVAAAVRADRRRLVREVFGIPAIHRRDPGQRSFNPYALYQRFLSRGRVFLLPLALLRQLVRALILGLKWFRRTLNDLRHPELRPAVPRQESFSDLRVALRKVHRMRKPVFLASTWLRAQIDVEYLGLRLPGESEGSLEGSTVFEDLDMIGANPEQRADYQRLAETRRAQLADCERFLQQQGLLGAALEERLASRFPSSPSGRRLEVVRAISAACAGNYAKLRDLVSGPRQLRDLVTAAVQARGRRQGSGGLRRGLHRLIQRNHARASEQRFETWWLQHGLALVPAASEPAQAKAWVHRWWRANHHGMADLIEVIAALKTTPTAQAAAVVDQVIRNTRDWSEQLVMLRTIQALTILDILSTTHVIKGLGQYREDDDTEEVEVRVTML